MRIPLYAAAVCALFLSGSFAGAQDLDEKAMQESIKKGTKVPSASGKAVELGKDAAKAAKEKGSVLALEGEDEYKKLVGAADHVFLGLHSKGQADVWAPAGTALISFAKKHGGKVASATMEMSAARKAGIPAKLGVHENASTYLVLIRKGKRRHGFDTVSHAGVKDDGKPRKLSRLDYYEAAVHHCLTKLEIKPEPKEIPCDR